MGTKVRTNIICRSITIQRIKYSISLFFPTVSLNLGILAVMVVEFELGTLTKLL